MRKLPGADTSTCYDCGIGFENSEWGRGKHGRAKYVYFTTRDRWVYLCEECRNALLKSRQSDGETRRRVHQ